MSVTDDRLGDLERDVAVLGTRFDAAEKRAEERHSEQCTRLGAITSSLDARTAREERAREESESYRRVREAREEAERADQRRWTRSMVATFVSAIVGGGALVSWAMPSTPDVHAIAEQVGRELQGTQP